MTPRGRWRRRGLGLAVLAVVLALHAVGLQGWPVGPATPPAGPRGASLQAPALEVRAIAGAPASAAARDVLALHEVAAHALSRAVPSVAAPAAGTAGVADVAAPTLSPHGASTAKTDDVPDRVPDRAAVAPAGADAGIILMASVAASAATAASLPSLEPAPETIAADAAGTEAGVAEVRQPAQASGGQPVGPAAASPSMVAPPVYPTRLPPSFRWTFHMQRGVLSGTGTLLWQLDDGRYRLVLDGSVAGVTVLEWVSQGGIDAAGVAPERFVVDVRGRGAQAANFQRGAGKITYSARSVEHPLPAGAQDRLSWLVQLSAVVAAAPEVFARPGTEIAMVVSGVRGDVGLWQFVVQGPRDVDTPAGRLRALALRREARRPYDTRGEVWLDPSRHHLPVQVALSTIDGNGRVTDSLSLSLESTSR
jgi:hypothetical protein